MPTVPQGTTLRAVFEAHATFVGRTLRYLGASDADLEDLVQEVFVVVCRRLSEFAGRSSLRTWLYQICLRVALANRRTRARRAEVFFEQPIDRAEPPSQTDELERRRARVWLQRILATLDDDKRTVFVLYEIERLPMMEISTIVGCPLQTAYSRLHSARKHVQRLAKRERLGSPQ